MKLGDLKNIESVMVRIINSELPIRLAFQISVFADALSENLTRLEDFRIRLVKKHGRPDEHGNIAVPPKNMEAFTRELKELMESDVDIKMIKLGLEVFEENNIKLSIKELNALVKAGLVDKLE